MNICIFYLLDKFVSNKLFHKDIFLATIETSLVSWTYQFFKNISTIIFDLSKNTGLCFIYKISHITHHIINLLCIRDSCSGMPAIDK